MSGKFITFEGPEGGGKSTQLKLLSDYLDEQGVEHITTREPGGTAISEQIRNILLNPEHLSLTDRTELLLMLAARAQHTEEVLLPALKEGKIVLCDRYNDSTIAYQSFGDDYELEQAWKLCNMASWGLVPDRTYLFDIDPEQGIERSRGVHKQNSSQGNVDRMEAKDLAFHQKVRQGFLTLAEREPDRFLVLDATRPVEEVQQIIVADIIKFIGK